MIAPIHVHAHRLNKTNIIPDIVTRNRNGFKDKTTVNAKQSHRGGTSAAFNTGSFKPRTFSFYLLFVFRRNYNSRIHLPSLFSYIYQAFAYLQGEIIYSLQTQDSLFSSYTNNYPGK